MIQPILLPLCNFGVAYDLLLLDKVGASSSCEFNFPDSLKKITSYCAVTGWVSYTEGLLKFWSPSDRNLGQQVFSHMKLRCSPISRTLGKMVRERLRQSTYIA